MERVVTPEGIEVTCLLDGQTTFGAEVFPDLPDDRRAALLAAAGTDQVRTRFNAYLLRGPGVGVTLVDCGCGAMFGEAGGRLAGRLTALGIAPGDVTRIIYTHLHSDHCGGALDGAGAPLYPRAEVVLQADEHAFWLGKDSAGGRMLAASAAQVRTIAGAADLGGGLVAWPLPGHTPGHMGLRIGATVALWGDAVHAEDLQFRDPAIGTRYDTDAARARDSRLAALRLALDAGLIVGGGHLLQGLGRIVAQGGGVMRDDGTPPA